MYLTDGKQQFKIRYNPKVSSYKTTLQEAKIDTLGGQYPFFFRNGQVKYKEMALSGLISYLEDEKEMFINHPNNFQPTTNLTDQNIIAEREFRDKVVEWLNNGEIKYFKSPTEGSLLVRLMNISLSPTDSLSRLVYSFNSTAIEAAENNRTNLEKYQLLPKDKFVPTDNIYTIGECTLAANTNKAYYQAVRLEILVNQSNKDIPVNALDYEEKMHPTAGTKLIIGEPGNESEIYIPVYIKKYIVPITASTINIKADKQIKIIYQLKNYDKAHDSTDPFELIQGVNENISPTLQIRQIYGDRGYLDIKDILENEDTNNKNEIACFAYLSFHKDPEAIDRSDETKFAIELNGEIIKLDKIRSYYLENIDFVSSLHIGVGVILECAYYVNNITYKEG